MSESSWIAGARRGDQVAWEALMHEHQTAAFRLAYLLLGDADDAADTAQEAFIRAFRALDRFDTARPFRPWLLRITANLAHNRRRSVARYAAAVGRLIQSSPQPGLAAGATDGGDEARALWQAVRRLGRNDQEVIYLRYFLDLPVAETAEALNVAPGTVKSRLHRALEHLRAVVDQEFPMLREEWTG
jgi:RNA polymerase sigma-70 factor (ECF subfamily)